MLLPGIVAVVFLALFLGAPYLTGLADIWDIVLVVVGLILIALEIFVIPGFGIAGIAGIALLIVGLIASFVPPEWPDQSPFHLPATEYAWMALQSGILAVMRVAGDLADRDGPAVAPVPAHALPAAIRAGQPAAPSRSASRTGSAACRRPAAMGVTIGPLRPAGKARFGEKVADVVTEGEFIEPSQPVEVLAARGQPRGRDGAWRARRTRVTRSAS